MRYRQRLTKQLARTINKPQFQIEKRFPSVTATGAHLPLGDFTMNAEFELNNQPVANQPVAVAEAHTDVPNNSNSTLYQSILAEPLLTTVLCYQLAC